MESSYGFGSESSLALPGKRRENSEQHQCAPAANTEASNVGSREVSDWCIIGIKSNRSVTIDISQVVPRLWVSDYSRFGNHLGP